MNSLAQQLRRVAARNRGQSAYNSSTAAVWGCYGRWRRHCVCVLPGGSTAVDGDNSHAAARRSRLEAVLFLAREPLALRKLAQLANLTDGTEARTLLRSLREGYDERGCAFQVAQVAGGYQLMSRREFATWLRPQGATEREIRLSPPAMEILTVVAYRQPVLRAEVEAIRGVACGEILRQLLDRDLLRIVDRSEELGRPLRYGTTKRFLEVFGLCSLDQLPWATQLRRSLQAEASKADLSASEMGARADLTADSEAA